MEDTLLQHSKRPYKIKSDKEYLQNVTLSYFYAILSLIVNCVSSVTAQLLGSSVPVFELSALRSMATFLISATYLIWKQESIRFTQPRQAVIKLVTVVILNALQNISYYTAVQILPVGNLNAVTSCTTIVGHLTVVIAWKFKSQYHVFVASGIAMLGLLAVTQPPVIFAQQSQPEL